MATVNATTDQKASAEAAYAAAAEAAPVATAKAVNAKPTAPKTKTTVKSAKAEPAAAPAAPVLVVPAFSNLKDTIMTKTETVAETFTTKVKETVAEAQTQAKTAFEKGSALVGDATEFSKGNLEALVESGKILAAGLQEIGKTYAEEGKSAFETVSADVKELAAVKSPTDFFKLQGEIARRNLDAAVTSGSKHTEAFLKLANDAFAPLSTRMSLALDKVRKAA